MSVFPEAAGTSLTIRTFEPSLVDDATDCDLRGLRFIDAYGLVGTACLLRTAVAENRRPQFYPPQNASMALHLSTMGLTDFATRLGLVASNQPPQSGRGDVIVPLTSAADAGAQEAISHLLWAQLRSHADPSVLQAVAEGVGEMVANAREHSGADALVMGQVYRRVRGGTSPDHDDRVQVVIGDVGQGIRNSFLATRTHAPRDDSAAIQLALRYLVTSVPNDRGRGQGLSTTMDEIVALQGRMYVRSGASLVVIDAAGQRTQKVKHIPGVIVALSLPLYPGSA